MFHSLLEMAELQGCSEGIPVESTAESTVESTVELTVESTVESGEPDIHTLKNELKALVKYNRHLLRQTTQVVKILNQITKKARDLGT